MLEPYEGKFSRTVLRGERGRKAPDPLGANALGFDNVQGGSVSFVQKFGSSLNATPHYHCLLLDGV